MASLKEIKGRIASIQSTQKITSAMRMVASVKLRRVQTMTEQFLRYRDSLQDIVESLEAPPTSPTGEATDRDWSLDTDQSLPSWGGERGILLVAISSNSGMCGAFNSNIAKATRKRIEHYRSQGRAVRLLPIGKKIARELAQAYPDADIITDYVLLMDSIEKGDAFASVSTLLDRLQQLHDCGDIGDIELIYHHFKSMGSQVITITPLNLASDNLASDGQMINCPYSANHTFSHPPQSGRAGEGLYLTEPSPSELLSSLRPRLLHAELYGTMLDSQTAEHAARMLAMQTADDNANDLLKELTLLYNKTRQQAITNELIDIMGGKTA